MDLRIHHENPAEAVEQVYFRIQREQMADVPILNPALSVEAVDFQRWQGHWLGALVTPWSLTAILVPGGEAGWQTPGDNQRRFVKFPAGDFAFLGNVEPEVGEFQTCALIAQMNQFARQSEAVMTARGCLIAMLQAPAAKAADKPVDKPTDNDGPQSPSRRRLFFGRR